jgi:hypothetical protein
MSGGESVEMTCNRNAGGLQAGDVPYPRSYYNYYYGANRLVPPVTDPPTYNPHLLYGQCTGGAGPNLSRYPNLVYSPSPLDAGVRTHLAGKSIEEIVNRGFADEAVTALDRLAKTVGVSFDELCDALRYARAQALI